MADYEPLADDVRILRALYQLTRGVDSPSPVESSAPESDVEAEPQLVADVVDWAPRLRRRSARR
jgi:hypothetical protein